MEKKSLAGKIDFFFNKLLPKKFLVVAIATVIVFKEINAPKEYWYLLWLYFGGNVVKGIFSKKDL